MWDDQSLALFNRRAHVTWLAQKIAKTLKESGTRIGQDTRQQIEEFVASLPENDSSGGAIMLIQPELAYLTQRVCRTLEDSGIKLTPDVMTRTTVFVELLSARTETHSIP